MAILSLQSFIKHIPIRLSRVCSLPFPINPTENRLSFTTQISLEDEIMNQITAANKDDPSLSREEICINYIRHLCESDNLQTAAKLPQNLRRKHNFNLTPRAYNYLLEAADRNHDIEMLSKVFQDLLVNCGSITLSSYLIFARAIGKHDDSVVLLSFIGEVCELELPRIDVVLNRFVFALAKCGYSDSALLVADRMRSLKCKPDLVTYNTVLAILGRSGRVDEMMSVFGFMKTVDLLLDVVTYNTVLHGLRKMGRLDFFLLCFKEMVERGIRPDVVTYKALVEGLGRSGNIEGALKVFDEMKRKGITPSVHVYRAIIFSLKKMGKIELALEFSTEMNKVCPRSVVPRDFQYKNR